MSVKNYLFFYEILIKDGVLNESKNNRLVFMVMHRLSVIDLSSRKQPIYNNDKNIKEKGYGSEE